MKNIFKILSLIVFVMLISSCQKDNVLLHQENETESQFKCADEDDIIFVQNPIILGQIIVTLKERALGIIIELKCGDIAYLKNTGIDEGGNFSFIDLQPETYTRNVFIGGQLISSTTYRVSY